MTDTIRNSFIWRGLFAFLISVRDIFHKGTVFVTYSSLRKYYNYSATICIWTAFCAADNFTVNSLYGRTMAWIRRVLEALGDIAVKSCFYRILIRLRNLYFHMTKGSVVFSYINKLSLHQWVLAAFVLYLPLEYVIRDVLPAAFIASIWEEMFILDAVVLVLWRRALRQTQTTGRETPLDGYLILFMAVGLLLMSAVNPYPAVALAGYRAVVEYLVWFFIIIRLIEDDEDFKVVYYTFIGMGALLCLHGIYQYVIAVPIPSSWVSQTEMGVRTRVFSLTGSPNIFGSLIVMIAPMAAAMIYYCRKTYAKLFFIAVTGMMCLCLLFTFSRGAWVGIVVAVILFSLYTDRRLLSLMVAAIAGVLIFVPSITSRLTYLFTSDYAEASAVGGRALRWETGRMLLTENNPWLGFGLGRFGGAVAMNNQILDETEEFSYFYMDNYYLKTMVEMGYIGIIFFVLLILALVVWGFRAIYRSGLRSPGMAEEQPFGEIIEKTAQLELTQQDPLLRSAGSRKVLAVGIFSGLAGVLVHCHFENIFEEPYMMAYFWGLAASLMYLGFFSSRQ